MQYERRELPTVDATRIDTSGVVVVLELASRIVAKYEVLRSGPRSAP